MSFLVLAGAAGLVVGVSAWRWRWSVMAALWIAVFEGVLRKWVMPGANELLYFLKDLVLAGAYLGAMLDAGRRRVRPGGWVEILVVVAGALVVLQALNPNQGSVLAGLFGAKVYLFYVPLLWLVPDVFRSRRELVMFLQGILLLALPIGVLGALQYAAPPDSWWNVYSNETRADGVAVVSDGLGVRARITGTFSYIAGYTAFLGFVFGLVIPLLAFPPGRGWLAVNLVAAVLVVGNMFMTGSRAPVLFVALSTALLGWAVFRMPGAGGRRLATTLGVLAVGLGVAGTVFGEARESLLLRARSSDSLVERLGWSFRPFAALNEVGLTGFGAGVTHPARYAVQRVLRQPPPLNVPPAHDFEPMQVLVELGAAGFLAWYALKVALLAGLWRTWRRLAARPLGLFAMAAFAFHLAHLYLSVVLNHTANLLYWFTAGFIVLLPRLELAAAPARADGRTSRGRGQGRGRGPGRGARSGTVRTLEEPEPEKVVMAMAEAETEAFAGRSDDPGRVGSGN